MLIKNQEAGVQSFTSLWQLCFTIISPASRLNIQKKEILKVRLDSGSLLIVSAQIKQSMGQSFYLQEVNVIKQ